MKCLVACPHHLLLVDLDRGDVGVVEAGRREYYGISWTPNGQQLCLSHSGLDNAALGTMESYLNAEQGWLSLGSQSSPRCLAAPHQVLCQDTHIVAANTGRNCLTVFQPDNLFYQHRWLDGVRWDRKGRDKPCGSHFNSLAFHDGNLYVLAHNFDRGSYVLVLSWPNLRILDRIDTAAQHSHNLWPWPGGELMLCHSTSGALVEARSGQVVWQADGVLTRGLACAGRYVLVGGSALATADQRPLADSRIAIVDRTDWKQIDVLHLPGAGAIHEIRIIDAADECHHGRALQAIPAVDPVATAAWRQRRASGTTASLFPKLAGEELEVRKPRGQRRPDRAGVETSAPSARPPRIGIWPDYGYEVQPDGDAMMIYALGRDFEGFVRQLGQGLAESGEAVELVPLDRRHLRALAKVNAPGVRLLGGASWLQALQPHVFRFTDGWLRWTGPRGRCLRSGRRRAGDGELLRPYWELFGRGRLGPVLAGLVLLPFLFLLAWAVFALRQIGGGVFRGLLFPVQVWHRAVLRSRKSIRQAALKRAQAAACDAWLVPALRRGAGPHWVEEVEWGQSAMQLLRPAAAMALPTMNHSLWQRWRPADLTRPYLFVPCPLRAGPFLEALPLALELLDEPLDIVCTGLEGMRHAPTDCPIHVIDCGDPRTRAALYRGARAAVLPTLDLDLMQTLAEALHGGCPLLAASVPALTPCLQAFGATIAWFDPAWPESLARAVRQTIEDRDWIHNLQKQAGQALWQRTWADAARELLQLARPSAVVQGEPTRSYFQTASGR